MGVSARALLARVQAADLGLRPWRSVSLSPLLLIAPAFAVRKLGSCKRKYARRPEVQWLRKYANCMTNTVLGSQTHLLRHKRKSTPGCLVLNSPAACGLSDCELSMRENLRVVGISVRVLDLEWAVFKLYFRM